MSTTRNIIPNYNACTVHAPFPGCDDDDDDDDNYQTSRHKKLTQSISLLLSLTISIIDILHTKWNKWITSTYPINQSINQSSTLLPLSLNHLTYLPIQTITLTTHQTSNEQLSYQPTYQFIHPSTHFLPPLSLLFSPPTQSHPPPPPRPLGPPNRNEKNPPNPNPKSQIPNPRSHETNYKLCSSNQPSLPKKNLIKKKKGPRQKKSQNPRIPDFDPIRFDAVKLSFLLCLSICLETHTAQKQSPTPPRHPTPQSHGATEPRKCCNCMHA